MMLLALYLYLMPAGVIAYMNYESCEPYSKTLKKLFESAIFGLIWPVWFLLIIMVTVVITVKYWFKH